MRSLRLASALALPLAATLTVTLAATPSTQAAPSPAAAPAPSVEQAAQRVQQRPNVIVLFGDDMRLSDLAHLPGVERLARRGVRFTRAVSPDSLCCPARATLLTGKLAHNHRTVGNRPSAFGGNPIFKEHNPPAQRVPAWMQDAGYRTGYIGKYLNSSPKQPFQPPDWDYFAVPYKRVYSYHHNVFSINERTVRSDRYREAFQRDLLMDRVRSWSRSDTPYLIYYSSLAPHSTPADNGGWEPPHPGEGHQDDRVRGLRGNAANREADLSDKPLWLRRKAGDAEPTYKRRSARQRIRSMMSLEDTVVRLEKFLAAHPAERRRTIVAFTSDNGFMLGEHRLSGKNYAYQQSLRIPMLVAGPGFPAGTTNATLTGLQDLPLTAMRAAEIEDRHGTDGVPMQRLVRRPGSYADRAMVVEGSTGGYGRAWKDHHDAIGRFYRGAVTRDLTYVEYADGETGYAGGSREFYDRATDGQWELANRWTDPDYAPQRQRLYQWFLDHRDCQGAACNERLAP